jgi:hypothetical protein
MPAPTTPLARSKSAALTRVLDCIPRGYTRYTAGTIPVAKLPSLVSKLHRIHSVAASPAQRITRKKLGQANAVLSLYLPEGADTVHWLMLFTEGELDAHEKLRGILDKQRLRWLDYELTRYGHKATTRWTWHRPKEAMQDLYVLLNEHLKKQHWNAVRGMLERIAAQPGFHGVRAQSWRLCQQARRRGYTDELPHLFYMSKVSHGDRMEVLGSS